MNEVKEMMSYADVLQTAITILVAISLTVIFCLAVLLILKLFFKIIGEE